MQSRHHRYDRLWGLAIAAALATAVTAGRPGSGAHAQTGTTARRTTVVDSLRLPTTPAAAAAKAHDTSVLGALGVKPKAPTPESPVRLSPLVRPTAVGTKTIMVPLDLGGAAAEKTRVLSRQGQGWQSAAEALRVVNGQRAVAVPEGGSVVVAPTPDQQIVTKLLSRSGIAFPGAIVQARATPAGTQAEILSLTVEPITWPMSWNAERKQYLTQLRVLLKANQKLAAPSQDLLVRFRAQYATVEPTEVLLRAGAAVASNQITVAASRHVPTPMVMAECDLGRVQNELEVDLGAPKLKLRPSVSALNGFGLESTTLLVTSVADDDIDLVPKEPLRISLSTDRGTLERPEITIPRGQSSVQVPLRSAGIGVAHVSAVGAFATASVEVDFGFPTVFLLLVLAGGTVGGALHWIRRAARAKASVGMLLLEGALVGPVLVIALLGGASFAGVSATQLVASDAGRFTMAVVFGFIGTPAVDALRRYAFKVPGAAGDGPAQEKDGAPTGARPPRRRRNAAE